ncbi:MAG TPA: FAD/NAD(P)-binding protein [Gammaproteobacteria bacterium]|nr:FAD/NAD(P)-binding protein [Gammaproteobacteria bacterium]
MRTLAIVGAGFSGAATAIQLLRRHGQLPFQLALINRHPNLARGVAYGTQSPSHLLNVPAGRMGLFPDQEGDFLDFVRHYDSGVTAGSFVPRSLYGRYLEARLKHAAEQAAAMRLQPVTGEVQDLSLAADGRGALLKFSDGRTLDAEHVVLAVGNYPPADPSLPEADFFHSRQYIRDPWSPGALDRVPLEAPVLLMGTGLTMMDVALELAHRGQSAVQYAISRRGLLPQVHRQLPAMPLTPPPAGLLEGRPTARRYLKLTRAYVEKLAAHGGDWRDAIGALRPLTSTLWQALSPEERRRFLRHAQAYWDVHRHRTAPASGEQLGKLLAAGSLQVAAGRLRRLTGGSGGVRVLWQPRGSTREARLQVGSVINCTGPQNDITRLSDPLVRSLLAQGLIRPDPLRLGLDVDQAARVLDNGGRPSGVISYTGPLLRARDWEATAVPELRVAARKLADRLAGTW